ncbi:MAG TPA: PqqD family protein [Ilumatobacteraceae bacterium]|nr:PqqD family protein [Ilumatobacteraceae bacterium]
MSSVRFRRHPAAVWRATEHFLVAAVPPAHPTRVVGSAGLVWKVLATPKSMEEIASEVVASLGTVANLDRDVVAQDVRSLIDQLLAFGLVEVGS